MQKPAKILIIITGLIPILGVFGRPPDVMLLIYTVFVAALLFREKLTSAVANIRLSPPWKFLVLMIISGTTAETLAWISNFLAREPQPALLHPQLIPDLILGFGFYSGWAAAWLLTLRFWRFSLVSVFLATGLSGIWTEQSSAIFVNLTENLFVYPTAALYSALYIVAVYGAIAALAFMLVSNEISRPERSNHLIKYPVVWILLFFLASLTTGIVLVIASLLKLIPEAKPIWEYPFF